MKNVSACWPISPEHHWVLQEAVDEYPDAEVLDHQTQACACVPDVPFDTFDLADAGEEW